MYDAIVVGARCAGSAIGLLLAGAGLRVLMLDRARFPSDMPMSTHFVQARGVACLARWGLRDAVVATGAPSVTRFDIDLGPFTLTGSPPPVDGELCAFAPRRLQLDELLVRAAEAAGVELREACSVQNLLSADGRVIGVAGIVDGGTRFEERARIVIGADGPQSRVATEVHAEEFHVRPALEGTAWTYWKDLGLGGVELHLRDGEGVYAFPSNGCTLVGVNWAIDRFEDARRHPEPCYADVLERAAPILAERMHDTRRAQPRLNLALTRNFIRKAHGPGWVLVGDARCKKDFCTAQGITDAFADAEALASALIPALRGERETGAALDAYERDRNDWVLPYYELTCQLATFAPPPPDMLALYTALRGQPHQIARFIGLITQAESPAAFFAPESVGAIMAGAMH